MSMKRYEDHTHLPANQSTVVANMKFNCIIYGIQTEGVFDLDWGRSKQSALPGHRFVGEEGGYTCYHEV